MADDIFINSAEYTALSVELQTLRARIEQAIAEYDNLAALLAAKTDTLTWKQINTLVEQKFQVLSNKINDVNQFATTAYLLDRSHHTGPEIVNANVQLGANVNSNVGFFGSSGGVKQTVGAVNAGTAGGTYTASEQAMLQDVHDKLNTLITALKVYSII